MELELELAKYDRLRLRPRVAVYQLSTDCDFGRMVMRRPENIEKQEEMASGSMEVKLKCDLVIEFRLTKGIGGNFGVIAIIV